MPISRRRALAELALIFLAALLGLICTSLLFGVLPAKTQRWASAGTNVGLGLAMSLAGLLILAVARHKPLTVGWTRKRLARNVGLGLAALVIIYIIAFVVGAGLFLLDPHLLADKTTAQRAIEAAFPKMPLAGLIFMCVFVGLWEEFVFRGFVLTRMYALFRRWWLAIAVEAGIFGLIHIYEGWLGVAVIAALAAVMGALFAWRKSLVPSITMHVIHDVVILLVIQQQYI